MVAKNAAYQAFRDSGVEWVGDIPYEWAIKPLFACVNTECLKNDDGKEKNVLSLSYGRIVRRDVEKNSGLLPESFNTYQLVSPGDIILRLTDLQNDKRSLRVGYARESGMITSAYLKLMAKKCHFNDRFLHLLLHSYDTTKVFYGMGGGLRQSMKFDEMRRLPLLVPSLAEQTQIANFLDHETAKIDTLIDKQQQLIKLLKEKRQAVISHAVTKGLNPDAPMKDSGVEWLGEVPEHWEVTRLKYECSCIVDCMHSTPQYEPDGVYPAIRTADISPGFLDILGARKVSENVFHERNERLVPRHDDIIYSREGERYGMAALVPENINVCLAQRVMLFRAKCPESASYLMWHLNSNAVYMQAYQDVIGSTSPHINVETIKNFYMAWPPLRERQDIAVYISSKLEKFDKLVEMAENKILLLQERRTALISAAVTGKIDVRNWQPEQSESRMEASA